jgi:hypothetical protein
MRGSFKRLNNAETAPQLLDKQFGHLELREMPTPIELIPVEPPGIDCVGPASCRLQVVRKDTHANGESMRPGLLHWPSSATCSM